MSDNFIPFDQKHRLRIENELDITLFVEAGAGTGKTREMVQRIVRLIVTGKTSIERIAAITFTEAAAAELKDKVRNELEKCLNDQSLTSAERKMCDKAVSSLDIASIQTLHSFAASLLREKPIEAGLPPNFKIVTDIEENIDFEDNWRAWRDQAVENEETSKHLFTAMAMGLRLDQLKEVAKSLQYNYERLPERFESDTPPVRQTVKKLLSKLVYIKELTLLVIDDKKDLLFQHAQRLLGQGEILTTMDPDGDAALASLANFGKLSCTRGATKNWNNVPGTHTNACTELKNLLSELEESKNVELVSVRRTALMPLLESLRTFVLDYVEQRRISGKAQFQDLLVWARNLIKDNPEVRAHFQDKFTHILIDEFQDTDPIQAEIAFFLAADRSALGNSALTEKDWKKLSITPGKLFVVGDPKQSIYRFRRADIATVQETGKLMGDCSEVLQQNFRSQEPIINWVNSIFKKWMGAGQLRIQASYCELSPKQWNTSNSPTKFKNIETEETKDTYSSHFRPGVYKFGVSVNEDTPQVRNYESSSIANVLRNIKISRWKIRNVDECSLREAEFRDICILIPSRSVLPSLERALDEVNIPHRVESESFVLGSQDVRDLMNCLRSIDSPADQVALVAALRSSAFSCSDVELLEFADKGGNFDYTNHGSATGPVAEALEMLARYNHEKNWTSMDKLIEKFVRERCMEEASFLRSRPRERLRRLKIVIEQARGFATAGENSLRKFADWMEQQAQEGARMVEIPVPEADEDAVRIMTVHAAKGLEFPIVILAGLGSSLSNREDHVIFDRDDNSVQVRISSGKKEFVTAGYERVKEKEKAAESAEGVRLMYVAATRARDYLLISLYRKASKTNDDSYAAIIERLAGETGCIWNDIDCSIIQTLTVPAAIKDTLPNPDTEADREQWIRDREIVFRQASKKPAIAVTEIASVAKEQAEGGEVYYLTGRGGTNLGRAVHSVLQSIDLATARNLEELAKAQANGEGIHDRWQEVLKLAQNGLSSKAVQRALASNKFYREVFVGAPLEKTMVEGFVDLIFEENGGLVVVDYKTDALDNEDEEIKRSERYKLQAGTYALSVEKVTGKRVTEVILVFLRSGKEISISYIESLKLEVQERITSLLL